MVGSRVEHLAAGKMEPVLEERQDRVGLPTHPCDTVSFQPRWVDFTLPTYALLEPLGCWAGSGGVQWEIYSRWVNFQSIP